MNLEISEEQLNGLWKQLLRWLIVLFVLFVIWEFVVKPIGNSVEQGQIKANQEQAALLTKQICSDIDSLNKLQQDPNSVNPAIQRMKGLLSAYESKAGKNFTLTACLPQH